MAAAPKGHEGREHTAFERWLFAKPITPRRAGRLIATTTLTLTVAGGLAAWLLDANGVGSFGDSIWWAMQTVTTVGYGDVVPEDTTGRIIGALLMLNGVALISVITAVVTATLMEQARRRRSTTDGDDLNAALARIEARLESIEASLSGGDQAGER
jgi:voltage-gated potassium channel